MRMGEMCRMMAPIWGGAWQSVSCLLKEHVCCRAAWRIWRDALHIFCRLPLLTYMQKRGTQTLCTWECGFYSSATQGSAVTRQVRPVLFYLNTGDIGKPYFRGLESMVIIDDRRLHANYWLVPRWEDMRFSNLLLPSSYQQLVLRDST